MEKLCEENKPPHTDAGNGKQPEETDCSEEKICVFDNVDVAECHKSEEEQCNVKVEVNDNKASSSDSANQDVSDKHDGETSSVTSNDEERKVEKLISGSNLRESHSSDASSLDDNMEADSSPKTPEISSQKKNESLALISSLYDYSSDSGSDSRSLGDGFSEHRSVCFSSNSEQLCSDDTEESDSDLESIIAKKPTFVPKQVKVLGELSVKDLPPIEDLHISVKEEECIPFGKVYSIVDTLLVVQSLPDKPALNLDSVFFRHNGVPVGRIFDVFGPVKRPFYSVRFNNNEDIHAKGLSVDVVLYAAPETKHTQYVFASQLMKEKGSDASWVNDCEPPPECIDYSDDEQEKNNRRKQKLGKKTTAVKVEESEESSPARKKYLSFEERMNRNNVMRNKYYSKLNNSSFKQNREIGWHNRIDRPPSTPSPQPTSSSNISRITGGTFHMRPPLLLSPSPNSGLPPIVRSTAHFPPKSFITYNHPPTTVVPPPHFNPQHPPPVWQPSQPPQAMDDHRFPMNYPPVQPAPSVHNPHAPPYQQIARPPPSPSDYFFRYQPPPLITPGPPIIRPQFSSPSNTSNNFFRQYSQFSRGGNSF